MDSRFAIKYRPADGLSVTIDTRGLDQKFAKLRREQIPSAMRHCLNDTVKDARKRVVQEIQQVFDRPTPVVQKLPHYEEAQRGVDVRAMTAAVWLIEWEGKNYGGPSHAVPHHVPGGPDTRSRKGLEKRLEQIGLIGPGEWMMPAVGAKLDQYGNIPGPTIRNMLSDLGGFVDPGYDANTKTEDRYTRGKNGKRRLRRGKTKTYFWAAIGLPGRETKGIWRKVAGVLVPIMVAVKGTPRYSKRFRFHDVVKSYSARRIGYHADRAVAQEIRQKAGA